MAQNIKMPSLGATMEEGIIIAWKVKESDTVKSGQVIVELETDKSTFEYESPCDGMVLKIITEAGETVPVNHVIAVIGQPGEEITTDLPTNKIVQNKNEEAGRADSIVASHSGISAGEKKDDVKISPKARKLAESLNVDITTITGSGPGGRIESGDIEKVKDSGR